MKIPTHVRHGVILQSRGLIYGIRMHASSPSHSHSHTSLCWVSVQNTLNFPMHSGDRFAFIFTINHWKMCVDFPLVDCTTYTHSCTTMECSSRLDWIAFNMRLCTRTLLCCLPQFFCSIFYCCCRGHCSGCCRCLWCVSLYLRCDFFFHSVFVYTQLKSNTIQFNMCVGVSVCTRTYEYKWVLKKLLIPMRNIHQYWRNVFSFIKSSFSSHLFTRFCWYWCWCCCCRAWNHFPFNNFHNQRKKNCEYNNEWMWIKKAPFSFSNHQIKSTMLSNFLLVKFYLFFIKIIWNIHAVLN